MLLSTSNELELGATPEPVASAALEATLPLPVSAKWVAYACRMAAIGKPRWDRHTARWTAVGRGEPGRAETVVMRQGASRHHVVIEVASPEATDSETGRRLITALFTGMQWAVRQRAL